MRGADVAEALDVRLAAEADPHAHAVDAVRLVAEALDLELAGAVDLLLAGLDQLAEDADKISQPLEQGAETDIDIGMAFGRMRALA